jgi:hypothetical protein
MSIFGLGALTSGLYNSIQTGHPARLGRLRGPKGTLLTPPLLKLPESD